MHQICIYIHMRTTININDEILKRASELTGIKEKTHLVRLGLESLIALESSRRLARLAGTEQDLQTLPAAATAPHDEVLRFIEDQRLMGLGLGYVDIHLLAAARLTAVPLWTNDKCLKAAA